MGISKEMTDWLNGQHPTVRKLAKAVVLEDDERVYHIGPDKIQRFFPRIPGSTAKGEDRTVSRICCSLDIARALYGGRHHLPENRIYLYEFAEREVLLPSTTLTQEGKRGSEVWIVPHKLANWNIKPVVVGEMRLLERTESGSLKDGINMTYVLRVFDRPVQFDKDTLLEPGKTYSVALVERWRDTVDELETKLKVELAGELPEDMFKMAAIEYTVKI